jgi:hypothetical protein
MTRMFTGGREDGSTNSVFSKYSKKSAKDVFIKKMRGIDDSQLTEEERYQKIMDKKMNDLRKKAMEGGSKYSFTPPGCAAPAEGEKKVSKGMEAFIQRTAAKQAKEELKKELARATVKINAKYLTGQFGGAISKDGKITGPDRKIIAKINKKSGKIMSTTGVYIGKYDPNSPMSEFKIQQYIAQVYTAAKKKAEQAGGSVWGSGMGNFYGNNDDKGGGFWG